MKASVSMNKSAIKILSRAQAIALSMTATQMLNETTNDAVMPFGDTGLLQGETYVEDSKSTKGEVSIVSPMLYSRRLYYHPEYNFRQDGNANAGGEWWEEWLSGDKRTRPQKLFKAFYKRVTGGYVK